MNKEMKTKRRRTRGEGENGERDRRSQEKEEDREGDLPEKGAGGGDGWMKKVQSCDAELPFTHKHTLLNALYQLIINMESLCLQTASPREI